MIEKNVKPGILLISRSFALRHGLADLVFERNRERAADSAITADFQRLWSIQRSSTRHRFAEIVSHLATMPTPISVVTMMRGGFALGVALVGALARLGVEVDHVPLAWVRGFHTSTIPSSHTLTTGSVLLVDGWTGSGESVREVLSQWAGSTPFVVAYSDPAGVCDLAFTSSDSFFAPAMLQSAACPIGRAFGLVGSNLAAALVDDDEPSRLLATTLFEAGTFLHDELPAVGTIGQRKSRERHVHLGVNECFRAVARGSLARLTISPAANSEFGIAELVERFDGSVEVADTRPYLATGVSRADERS